MHNFSRTVIIGNGDSVLKCSGSLIDSMDHVVRINDFKLDEFKDKCGTKFHSWVINEHFIRSGACSRFKGSSADAYCLFPFGGYSNYDDLIKELQIPDYVQIFSREEAQELTAFYDKTMKTWPSTGACAIWKFKPCYIVGFDHFKPGKKHYFSDAELEANPGHDSKKEKSFVNRLIKKGLVKWL